MNPSTESTSPGPNGLASNSWGPPPRGVFVDVLGTLVHPAENGHFPAISDATFYEGVLDALFRVTQAGWNLYLVGNVSSVAFGEQSLDDWKAFQDGLHELLKSQGIPVTRDYTCVDHPDGIAGRDRVLARLIDEGKRNDRSRDHQHQRREQHGHERTMAHDC